MHKLMTIAVSISAAMAAGQAFAAEPLPAWTQFTRDGVSLRVAVPAQECPQATGDGKAIALHLRAAATAEFPGVCEGPVPHDVARIRVNGLTLPGPRPAGSGPKRILVIGDTGCRIKGKEIQDCNDPKEWQFPQIAAHAAAHRPDLVIHVGDYYYRESPCPADRPGCAGSPYGDNWNSWSVEFFGPSAPLLAAAPWVFVRGNHESCGRGASGWFRFLDADSQPLSCPTEATPFSVNLGARGPMLHIVDSADTEDDTAPADKVALFRDQLDPLKAALAHGHGWVLTHRPIWGFKPTDNASEYPTSITEQVAAHNVDVSGVDMAVSGHVHIFSAIKFPGAQHPAQLIVGDGGDTPSAPEADAATRQITIDGAKADTFTVRHYGYLVLDRVSGGWRGTLYGADDKVMAGCDLRGRNIACKAQKRP